MHPLIGDRFGELALKAAGGISALYTGVLAYVYLFGRFEVTAISLFLVVTGAVAYVFSSIFASIHLTQRFHSWFEAGVRMIWKKDIVVRVTLLDFFVLLAILISFFLPVLLP